MSGDINSADSDEIIRGKCLTVTRSNISIESNHLQYKTHALNDIAKFNATIDGSEEIRKALSTVK